MSGEAVRADEAIKRIARGAVRDDVRSRAPQAQWSDMESDCDDGILQTCSYSPWKQRSCAVRPAQNRLCFNYFT